MLVLGGAVITCHTLFKAATCDTHLEVKELAVASVNDFCTAITPGHFDDVNLKNKRHIYKNISN